jgi:GntR family transcriptional repressor for pyruvate dehydrogenase complex
MSYVLDETDSLRYKEVALKIKKMIYTKKLLPGAKIPNENTLCEMMGASRPTIREAIKYLSSINIVEVRRGKGTYVSEFPGLVEDPLGVKFIDDKNILLPLFEVRIIIEPQVAKLAAERVSKADLLLIKKSIENMEEHVALKKNHSEVDLEFHLSIARATKNPIIERIVPIINESIVHGYVETVHIPGSAEKAISLHKKVYEAIKNKDGISAKKNMEAHLQDTINDILNL